MSRRKYYTTKHDVYRVYDENRTLLYVGCSINGFERIKQHKHERQFWWKYACTVDILQYPDKTTARGVEAKAIAEEHPIWNIAKEHSALTRLRGTTPEPIDAMTNLPINDFFDRVAA